MRADLTVRAADGAETDVRVRAAADATWAELLAALHRAGIDAEPSWVDGRRIDLSAPIDALRSGAVLSTVPSNPTALPPRLEVVGGLDSGRGVTLRNRAILVGRASDCDLPLSDPRVSRHHAIVTATAAGTTVRDVGSTLGTHVDGTLISTPRQLRPGNLVRVGDTYLAIAGGTPAPNAPRSSDVVFDWPGEPPDSFPVPLQVAAALVPGVVGAVLAMVLHSIELLAFALLSPVAMLATSIIERVRGRRVSRRRRTALRREREIVQARVRRAMDDEIGWRRAAHPDPAQLRRRPPSGARGSSGATTMTVRIGLGSLPASVSLRRDGDVETAGSLSDVPVTVDLANAPLTVAGPRRIAIAVARWVVLQIAATTSPADIEFAMCTAAPTHWRWLRWLPHLGPMIATTPDACRRLVDVLSGRGEQSGWPARHLVVLADDPYVARQLAIIARADRHVSVLALATRAEPRTPPGHVLRFECDSPARAFLDDVECVVDGVSAVLADSFARELAGRGSPTEADGSALPQSCTLRELGLSASATAISASWRRHPQRARALLGIGSSGVVDLDLDRDGPHGLIAGTTGAGKSELLQTLLLSLTAHSPPDELTALLFDFKGGAAFAALAELPHTVGLVTDLDDQLSRRMLVALRSELTLRERLLAAAGVPSRADYCATGAVLPRLVLVVDEFAALAEQLPDFVPGLVGVAQRGRSLGVHLLLATQRPGGVVSAEIRANTELRIALRTTSAAESVDVIDDPAAATIDPGTPGRAYLRTGSRLEAVQCARVGNPADEERVRVERLDEWNRPLPDPAPESGVTAARLGGLPAAIRAAAVGRPAPRRPWLPPLPDRVDAAALPGTTNGPSSVPIGLADRPEYQRYEAECVDLGTGGAVVFTGGPRSGRTSALLTLIVSAACQLAPDQLEVHAMIGGPAARIVEQLPHTGTVAELRDGAQVAAELLARLARRSGNRSAQDPATLLVVDDWDAWCTAGDELDRGRSVEAVLALIRAGPSTRTTVAVAGGRATLAPRLTALASARYVLRLADAAEYPIAGVDPHHVPTTMPPGRAINSAGVEVQLIDPADAARRAAECGSAQRPDRLRLRPLPDRVSLRTLAASGSLRAGWWTLGVGGDEAAPIRIDPAAGARRILIVGPPGSGRSNLLVLLLVQCAAGEVTAIAAARSPLAAAARRHGARVIDPSTVADPTLPSIEPGAVLLFDDADEHGLGPVGEARAHWLRTQPQCVAVVAARTDTLAIAPPGPITDVRQAGGGLVLLQPGPLDAHLVGGPLPRVATAQPGRGVLLPDPAWRLGRAPMPVQVAMAGPDNGFTPCAGTRG